AILAAHIARTLGESSVLSFDMGGTTAKICLIDDCTLPLSRTFEVDRAHRFMKGSGMPIKIPVVDMVEIGAGGGSLASVDELGRVSVGPESAGAEPGPACYGRGGGAAAVTDANLMLGRLDADGFAGGRIPLNTKAAQQAIQTEIGDALKTDAIGGAQAVIEIVDENMASAARVHAVEKGLDVTERTLIAFGGGAPLHAIAVARKLGIDRIIIPRDAGVGSAVGFLLAPVAFEVVRSRFTLLEHLEPEAINALFEEMEEEASATVRLGASEASVSTVRHAFIRYAGQGHEIKIQLPDLPLTADDRKTIAETFDKAYRNQYGQGIPGVPLEILTWSLTASAPVSEDIRAQVEHPSAKPQQSIGQRMVWMPGNDHPTECSVVTRQAISTAHPVAGPAVITEDQTTLVAPAGWTLSANPYG
ncbi:MAG TPA: methylhydantoinase, partial [Gammaproteobacteria bacterium]|nr:methylhydantoinase [Gammaproteobacteria bacterium]